MLTRSVMDRVSHARRTVTPGLHVIVDEATCRGRYSFFICANSIEISTLKFCVKCIKTRTTKERLREYSPILGYRA